MFFSTPNRCWIARLRSGGNCCHFGRTSLRMCWRCAGGRLCSRRLFSRTFCFSRGLRLLNSLFVEYADGGRFGLTFCRGAVSARFAFALGGRFAPEFCRRFCAPRASCCCCRRSCLCACLGFCFSRFGGLLSCRFCVQFARGPCAKHGTACTAPIPSPINHPANVSFHFICGYIC